MNKTKDITPQTLSILQKNIRELRDTVSHHKPLLTACAQEISSNSTAIRDLMEDSTNAKGKFLGVNYRVDNLKDNIDHFKKSQDKENNRIWIVLVLTALSVLANSYLTYSLYTK